MSPVLLTHMERGKPCTVRCPNGREYRRIVRYSKRDGLYIVIATVKYREVEMDKTELKKGE